MTPIVSYRLDMRSIKTSNSVLLKRLLVLFIYIFFQGKFMQELRFILSAAKKEPLQIDKSELLPWDGNLSGG